LKIGPLDYKAENYCRYLEEAGSGRPRLTSTDKTIDEDADLE